MSAGLPRTVSFRNGRGDTLVGSLQFADAGPLEVAILVPGFTRGRLSPTVTQIAGALLDYSIGSFRIDLAGCGDSDGSFADFTITNASEDVLAAKRLLAEMGVRRISAVGVSSGGLVVLAAALRDPSFQRLVLLAPVTDYPAKRLRELGATGVAEWKARDNISWVDPEGYAHTVGYRFLEDSAKWTVDERVRTLRMPITVIHGTSDHNTPIQHSISLKQHCPGVRLIALPEADHFFRVRGRRLPIDEMVAACFRLHDLQPDTQGGDDS